MTSAIEDFVKRVCDRLDKAGDHYRHRAMNATGMAGLVDAAVYTTIVEVKKALAEEINRIENEGEKR